MRTLITVLATLALSACMRDEALNLSYDSYQPIAIDDGIIISDPREEGIDPEKLDQIYHASYMDEQLWSLRSLLVFKNNGRIPFFKGKIAEVVCSVI